MLIEIATKLRCFRGIHEGPWIQEAQPGYTYIMQWKQRCKHCNRIKIVKDSYDLYKVNAAGELTKS